MTIKVDLLDRPGKRMGFDPVIIFLVLVVIVFVVFFVYWGKRYDELIDGKKADISKIDNKIRELEQKIPDIQKQEKENQKIEEQINAIKQLVYDPIRYRNLLDEIALIMPRNVFISNLNIDPKQKILTFGGTAVEIGGKQPLQTVSSFMQNIQKSPYFDSARLASTSRILFEGRTAYSFQIETRYNPETAARQSP